MLIIDTHCDTLFKRALRPEQALEVTPERLREGGVSLQVCALWAGPDGPAGDPYGFALQQMRQLAVFAAASITQVHRPADARAGETHILLSIEGGEVIGSSLDTLRWFRAQGVRMLALTWNHENAIGYPAIGGSLAPLKAFGWAVVDEMNRLGMAVDVSHLNEAGFWDVLGRNPVPPMASHSCCAALRPHFRNLTDEQLRALIAQGGWVGVNFCPAFLSEKTATLDDVVRHIDHIASLGGIDNVGLGSDFDGISAVPVGLEHPGRIGALLEALSRAGYSHDALENIAGKNFLRYFAQVEQAQATGG